MSRSTRLLPLVALLAAPLSAQSKIELPVVGTVKPYAWASPPAANPTKTAALVAQRLVRVPGASFLTLELDQVVLGSQSRIEISSILDGDMQTFDRFTFKDFGPYTAYFNGDAVLVELYAGAGTQAQQVGIKSVGVGKPAGGVAVPAWLCGTIDSRKPSTDPRVARALVTRGTNISICSSFLYSRVNAFATAGHCLSPTITRLTVEFNVPRSTSTGAIQHPAVTDQYDWEGYSPASLAYVNKSAGQDWGVFTTKRNATTQRWPASAQRGWYQTRSIPTAGVTLSVIGFGNDTKRKTWNHTQRSATGKYVGRLKNTKLGWPLVCRVDTSMLGSAGSPILYNGLVIGVVTADGCIPSVATTGNFGTPCDDPAFKTMRGVVATKRPQPDLVVNTLIAKSQAWIAGTRQRVTSRVANQAPGYAFTTTLTGLFLSSDTVITTSDRLLGSNTTPKLYGFAAAPQVTRYVRVPNFRTNKMYLGAFCDRTSLLTEELETNNTKIVPVQVTARPDLYITSLALHRTSVVRGGQYACTMVVRNGGQAATPTGSWSTTVRYSEDSTFTVGDPLLATLWVSTPIAPSASRTLTGLVTIPSTAGFGSRYVFADADAPTGNVAEYSEVNNRRALRVTVANGPVGPDLTATLGTNPTSVVAGARVSLSSVTKNIGSRTAKRTGAGLRFVSAYFLSKAATTTSKGDLVIGTYGIVELKPGAEISNTAPYTIPGGATAAHRYLGIFADSAGQIAELAETNNKSWKTISVAARPDIRALTFGTSTKNFVPNATVTLSSSVDNAGGATAPACSAGYYLSRDQVISSADLLLSQYSIPALAPSAAAVRNTVKVRIPVNAPSGSPYVAFFADNKKQVTNEAFETNNLRLIRVTVRALPDLIVTSVSSATTLVAGANHAISVVTKNQGNAPTSVGLHTGVFLSPDATITNTDILLGSYLAVSKLFPLAPGAWRTARLKLRIPFCTLPGRMWLGARADYLGVQPELIETNNTRSVSKTAARPNPATFKTIELLATATGAAQSTTFATFAAKTGGSLKMCVTAPQWVGKVYVCWAYATPPAMPPKLDFVSDVTLSLLNTPIFPNWFGVLDAKGQGKPALNVPGGLVPLAIKTYVSGVLIDPSNFNATPFGSSVTIDIK